MKLIKTLLMFSVIVSFLAGCKKDDTTNNTTGPKLIFKYKFDPTQERLGNLGNPTPLPANHGGQNPVFNAMSAHYIELAQGPLTRLGDGAVLYRAEEVTTGGSLAIDFEKAKLAKDGEMFYEVPLKNITAGDYEYLRVSLAYQNYDVRLTVDTTITVAGTPYRIVDSSYCTVASFIGFNTYVKNYKVKNQTITLNDDKTQGYWGFEYAANFYGYAYNLLTQGQAPAGATTVVNPLQSTSPIPAGSCVVTGPFEGGKLRITGNETKDIVVTVSLSTNKSFEWVEAGTPDGRWEPTKGEVIVDMGVRGLKPYVQY
ncbi:MAG: hypothetical protein KA149_08750 [Chitinophagales bacterium]|nr:hypothetical protein [Chitinophagales bacterium]